jgi:hypothetical protein
LKRIRNGAVINACGSIGNASGATTLDCPASSRFAFKHVLPTLGSASRPSLLHSQLQHNTSKLSFSSQPIHLRRSPYILFGRDKAVADLLCAHPSISKQHAVLQFRKVSKPDDFGIDQVRGFLNCLRVSVISVNGFLQVWLKA